MCDGDILSFIWILCKSWWCCPGKAEIHADSCTFPTALHLSSEARFSLRTEPHLLASTSRFYITRNTDILSPARMECESAASLGLCLKYLKRKTGHSSISHHVLLSCCFFLNRKATTLRQRSQVMFSYAIKDHSRFWGVIEYCGFCQRMFFVFEDSCWNIYWSCLLVSVT